MSVREGNTNNNCVNQFIKRTSCYKHAAYIYIYIHVNNIRKQRKYIRRNEMSCFLGFGLKIDSWQIPCSINCETMLLMTQFNR